MFKILYRCPRTIARHENGPLNESRRTYLQHLAAQGSSRKTLRVAAEVIYRAAVYMRLDCSGQVERLDVEDYADCPTCGRHWTEKGICGQRWTEATLRSAAARRDQPERIVKAEEFVLVDSRGRASARLAMEDGDSPMLALMYEDGARPNYFMMTPTGPVLRLGNRDGEEIMLVLGDCSGGHEACAFVHIADRNGYTTTIGRGRPNDEEIDRETWARFAASSVVLSKNREVIWSAP
jgi:hypothetical protein